MNSTRRMLTYGLCVAVLGLATVGYSYYINHINTSGASFLIPPLEANLASNPILAGACNPQATQCPGLDQDSRKRLISSIQVGLPSSIQSGIFDLTTEADTVCGNQFLKQLSSPANIVPWSGSVTLTKCTVGIGNKTVDQSNPPKTTYTIFIITDLKLPAVDYNNIATGFDLTDTGNDSVATAGNSHAEDRSATVTYNPATKKMGSYNTSLN